MTSQARMVELPARTSGLIHFVCMEVGHIADATPLGYTTIHQGKWAWCPSLVVERHVWALIESPMELADAQRHWHAGGLRGDVPRRSG